MQSQTPTASMIEMEHSIGYNGRHANTVHYHPTQKDTLIYSIGGLLVIEDLHDKHKQEFLRGHDMEISSIAISASGKLLATGQLGTQFQRTPEAPIIMWNFETRKPLAVLKGMMDCVKLLQFSPDGRFLAGVGQNNTFIIWNTQDGAPIHTRVTETAFTVLSWGDVQSQVNQKHPSYSLILGNQYQIFMNRLEFDISSMQYLMKQGICQLPNTGLSRQYNFSKCRGDLLLTGTNSGEICIFSVYNNIYRASMPISSNGIHCAALGQDHLFVGGGDGKLKKVNLAQGSWTLSHEAQLESKVMSINLSQDEKELIVGTVSGKMYRVLTSDLSFMLHSDAHSACINDVSFGQDSNIFAAIDESGCVKVWDLSEYKCLVTMMPAKQTGGVSCHLCKDDQTIMTGWRDGFLRCFDAQKRAQVWEIPQAHRGAITSVYADPNYILTGGQDGAVRVWQRQTRKLLCQFNDQKKDIVGLFPDAKQPNLIHSASMDRSVSTYDLKLEKRVNWRQIANGTHFSMTQRLDNELELVTAGQGSPILFWDCDVQQPVANIPYPYKVWSIQVSPSGRALAFGTETNEVFVYSMSSLTFTFLGKGLGHSAPVTKLKWTPDEKQIVSVSADASISVWNYFG